jgi:hypothetical protein
MKKKNTPMKQKISRKSKLLDNNYDNPFDKEIENELIDDEIVDDDEIDDLDDEELDIEDLDIETDKKVEEKIIQEVLDDKPKKRGRKADTTSDYYVEPQKFDEEIMKYYESGVMSNELAEMVSKISHKLSYAKNFINYSYREEMVGDGIIRMMKALIAQKYNRKKGTNPFSYFTRIAFNAFRNRIKKEKHIHETHEKYQREVMFMSEQINSLSKNNKNAILKERYKD